MGMTKSAGYWDLLKVYQFDVFWLGRIVSGLGDSLFTMATMWYVLTTTKSPLATAIVPMVPYLSFLIFGLVMATLADRMPKKPVLILVDLFRGVIIGAVFLLMLFHTVNALEIYIANFVLTAAGFLFSPAEQSALPSILPDAELYLPMANGLLISTSQILNLIGYAVGGAIISVFNPETAVFIDAFSFIFSALTFLPLKIPAHRAESRDGLFGFASQCVEGIRFILSKRLLRNFVIFGFLVNLLAAPLAIFTAIFSRSVLHAGVKGYGFLEAGFSAGIMLGALIAGRYSNRLRLWQWLIVTFGIEGITMIAIPIFPHLPISIGLFVVFSIAMGIWNIPFATRLQILAPHEMRGRIMMSNGLLVGGLSMPVGIIAGGWIVGLIGPSITFEIVGACLFAAAMISLGIRSFRDESELKTAQVQGEASRGYE